MMKVLMLGWEYPPHISGGLGVACDGLTKALSKQEVDITFLFPFSQGNEDVSHMRLIGTSSSQKIDKDDVVSQVEGSSSGTYPASYSLSKERTQVRKIAVPSQLLPYVNENDYQKLYLKHQKWIENEKFKANEHDLASEERKRHYSPDLFQEVENFASRALKQSEELDFDIIHAHDWMTFPAAMRISKKFKKPLVVHIHSLEYDRSPYGGDERIREVEKQGMQLANLVITVSQYTKTRVHHFYKIANEKIFPIYNGSDTDHSKSIKSEVQLKQKQTKTKHILYLGRVTYQKGTKYFFESIMNLLKSRDDVKVTIAGDGDNLEYFKYLTLKEGFLDRIDFPGFVDNQTRSQLFEDADIYVMPSVSEPFGLSAVEAIDSGVPTIITNQSGVAEILPNTLRYNFWDTYKLTTLMNDLLDFPEVRRVMTQRALRDTVKVSWKRCASLVKQSYKATISATNVN
jgi:glycogen(starch) synthase